MRPTRFIRPVSITIRTAWLSYIGLFTWLNPGSYVALKILWPIEQIIFFAILSSYASPPKPIQFYVIGNAVHAVALTGLFGLSLSIYRERVLGTLVYIFGSPASRIAVFGGRSLFYIADSLVSVAAGFLFGAIAFGLDFSKVNYGALVLSMAVLAFSTSAAGLLIGSVSLVTIHVIFFNNLVYFLMMLVCGVNVPVEKLPVGFQRLSAVLPLTRGLAAVRAVFAGEGIDRLLALIGGEALLGVAYLLAGYAIFAALERRARARATLELY